MAESMFGAGWGGGAPVAGNANSQPWAATPPPPPSLGGQEAKGPDQLNAPAPEAPTNTPYTPPPAAPPTMTMAYAPPANAPAPIPGAAYGPGVGNAPASTSIDGGNAGMNKKMPGRNASPRPVSGVAAPGTRATGTAGVDEGAASMDKNRAGGVQTQQGVMSPDNINMLRDYLTKMLGANGGWDQWAGGPQGQMPGVGGGFGPQGPMPPPNMIGGAIGPVMNPGVTPAWRTDSPPASTDWGGPRGPMPPPPPPGVAQPDYGTGAPPNLVPPGGGINIPTPAIPNPAQAEAMMGEQRVAEMQRQAQMQDTLTQMGQQNPTQAYMANLLRQQMPQLMR